MSKRLRLSLIVTVAVAMALSGCGGSSKSSAKLDGTYSPKESLSKTVDALLAAEQKGDHAASFALLTPDSRKDYKDVADWTSRRNELPAITAFHLDATKGTQQTVTVQHKPGLDPFKGLSPANETQVWKGQQFKGGWLVLADPDTTPVLPSEDKIAAAAKAWVEAVQACDQAKAHTYEAVATIFAGATPTICKTQGVVTVAAPQNLTDGPTSTDIVAQYTADALNWAKTVAITGPVNIHLVMAPIGDDWKVLGLY